MSDKEQSTVVPMSKCLCCSEYLPSVTKRGVYYNELFCTMCYDAKLAIDRIELERGY